MRYLLSTDKSNGGIQLAELLENLGFINEEKEIAKGKMSLPDLVLYERADLTEKDLEYVKKE